jgi:multidrug efflux system membrane fusion protein
MLFKPDFNETAKAAGDRVAGVASRARRRTVSIAITLLILGGLGYIGWTALLQKNGPRRANPDLAVPVLAATPRIQDVPVYLDGVGAVRALNTVTVRSQVDGKLIAVNFVEGEDVKKGDVVGEIDPVLYNRLFLPIRKSEDLELE